MLRNFEVVVGGGKGVAGSRPKPNSIGTKCWRAGTTSMANIIVVEQLQVYNMYFREASST